MKKLLTIILALILAFTFCACNKDIPSGSNTPDNVVPPKDTTASTDEAVTEPTQQSEVTTLDTLESEAESSEAPLEDEPDITEPQDDSAEIVSDDDEEEDPYIDIAEIIDIHEFKAYECIYLLNSDEVHAKFIEAISYDGEYVSGSEREIYVKGDEFVYITDGSHIIATHYEDVHVIDYDNGVYCIYEGGFEEEGDRFGYGLENYVNISSSEENGVITEVFEIETLGGTITSTWTFESDGTFTVVDMIDDSGAYYYYTFEILEDSFLTVDMNRASAMSAPNSLRLISVEEYEENY